ncbi:homocysteine S-methyltransferase family protein [Desulforegula conservatrix]|uniref:homocysteine S-methyltransferase family protein n=1 Tax=Desulforegula conservatrix TaxID=153026 RepID=UPI00040E98E7|nr:homocysteine S-methyltransferase family protein [Desulforegula conservatrix]
MDFLEALKKQVIVLDGAMGTMIQNLGFGTSEFGGEQFQMLSDLLNFSRPDSLKDIHIAYFKAGCNAVETNTFGASPLRLKEFDFSGIDTSAFYAVPEGFDITKNSYEDMAYHLSKAGCIAARRAVEEYSALPEYDGRPLFVVGSIGPSNHVLTSTKADLKISFWEEIEDNFYHQVLGLLDGGADVLLYETQQDALELKAAVSGGLKAMNEKGKRIPIMAQITVDAFSRMQIFGTDVVAALTALQGCGIDTFGVNCSIGPDLMEPTVEKLCRFSRIPVSVLPNAGMPESENGKTVYKLQPDVFASYLEKFVTKYGVSIVGGCCGTTPAHIKAACELLKNVKPKERTPVKGTFIAGPQKAVELDGSTGLIRIGERLNVRGSKKVREAVEGGAALIDFEALEEVASEQIKDLGISIIDVCMDSNVVDTKKVLPEVIKGMTVDFDAAMCIDSFDVEALVEAVKVYPGRPIINSISLEDHGNGKSKLDVLVPATSFHNPVYIALCADSEGPATTAEGKEKLARQIVEKCAVYGVVPEQLIIDLNAFPIGSEPDPSMNFALSSLEGVARVKAIHPDLRTSMGVGNLTNGLAKKPYMRVVLTSVFLAEARKKGLDAAIVNPNHYVPVETLDPEDRDLALSIIFNRDMDAFAKLEEKAELKKGIVTVKRSSYEGFSPEDALCEKIKDGFKERTNAVIDVDGFNYEYQDKIIEDAAKAIKTVPPLDLINDYLMKAMQELGNKFAAGEASLPHLLKSADIMKQVMGFIEFYIKQNGGAATSAKGTIVLGTVHQDVHSIGKDLAKTLLENYGYRVIDLGVQVPLASYIETAKAENATAIGMSALLVQTASHMITVAKMMKEAGLDIPVLIGGAPINLRHAATVAMAGKESETEIKSDVFYCASAMDCVNVMESLSGARRDEFIKNNRELLLKNLVRQKERDERIEKQEATLPRRTVSFDDHNAPEFVSGPKRIDIALKSLELDEKSLFSLNWAMGPGKVSSFKPEDARKVKADMIEKADKNGWITPRGAYAILPCVRKGSEIIIFDKENDKELGRIACNDMISGDRKEVFSLADYYKEGEIDRIGLQIVTAGMASAVAAKELRVKGDEESAFLLYGLAARTAEDLADVVQEMIMNDVCIDKKRGQRFSPGYPGLKNIENNRVIFNILNAADLGAVITPASAFEPVATTAAVVCFHPDVCYS